MQTMLNFRKMQQRATSWGFVLHIEKLLNSHLLSETSAQKNERLKPKESSWWHEQKGLERDRKFLQLK